MEVGSQSIVSHYDVLGAPDHAEYAEIRSKYRAAILALHPDKLCWSRGESLKASNIAANDSLRVLCTEDGITPPNKLQAMIRDLDFDDHQFNWSTISKAGKFKPGQGDRLLSRFFMVQKAWEVLRDPESRAKYDSCPRAERLTYAMKSTPMIGDEIQLLEMNSCSVDVGHGQEVEYSYACRCGDLIVVSQEELQMARLYLSEESQEARRGIRERLESHRPRSNSLLLPCQSYSMHVRVLFS